MISLNSTTYRLGNLDNYQAKLNFFEWVEVNFNLEATILLLLED